MPPRTKKVIGSISSLTGRSAVTSPKSASQFGTLKGKGKAILESGHLSSSDEDGEQETPRPSPTGEGSTERPAGEDNPDDHAISSNPNNPSPTGEGNTERPAGEDNPDDHAISSDPNNPIDPSNPKPDIPPVDSNTLLAAALDNLNRGLRKLRPNSTKVKEPESFDGSNPSKLREFLVSCSLVFSNHPDSFSRDEKRIRYAISYLKGAALDWFEPAIMDELDETPDWVWDYHNFVQELQDKFGPYDFRGDAETALSNLTMKDSHKVTHYIVEFNKLAARTEWNEPALRDKFFRGLPLRLRTEILKGGKPTSLSELRQKAQLSDQVHWMTKEEISRDSRAPPSNRKDDREKHSSSKDKNSDHRPRQPTTNPPSQNNSANSGFRSTNSTSRPNNSSKKPDLSAKLGKDGKLNSDERKRRMENNLCLYCGAGGHSAKDCRKAAANTRGRAAVASTSNTPSTQQDTPTSTSAESKN